MAPTTQAATAPGVPASRPVDTACYAGVAAIARAGLGVILDETLLDGGAGQRRVAGALVGLSVLWVGVRCDPSVASTRERGRLDRIVGMAASQAMTVHDSVRYDVKPDTTATSSQECAHAILGHVQRA
jgi:chloramphenicol 3-O phosphotransferase